MVRKPIVSEEFSSGNKHYFLDFKRAKNNRVFIQITRSDKLEDGSFKRNHVIVFEEDLPLLVQGLASLCHHAAYMDVDKKGIKKDLDREVPLKPVGGIKGWEPDMRPREKLMAMGPMALCNAELVALLIGSGTQRETAVDLSSRMLLAFGGLEGFSEASYTRLGRFSGMGMAKCSAILAAMELGRRLMALHLGSADSFLGELGDDGSK